MNIDSILAVKGREVRTIRPEAPITEAVRRMREERVGALVVSEDGRHIGGIISDRDVVNALADEGVEVMSRRVRDLMTREVFTCRAEEHVSTLMGAMTNRRIRHIPVVDGDGLLAGIVSIGDVVKHRIDEIQGEAEAMREYISGTR
ncbi:MAG TPA: CBS domain-containing protein [Geminicoccaceae bacterium]|nr:CBS domain-containing protein [Geminicoccaceae bacterium]